MKKELFNPDIFSDSIPEFEKSSDDVTELLKNLIIENYSQISSNIISVEQFKGNEINSNNYKVTTYSGVYLIKKFIDIDEFNKIKRVLLLNNWLSGNNVKLGKVYPSNKNEFVVKIEIDNSNWAIFDFINGSFFTGKSDSELISVGSEIGKFFNIMEKIPMQLYPMNKMQYFNDSEYLMNTMESNKNKWIFYFGDELSCILADNWTFLKSLYLELNENKEFLLSTQLTPCHIDLHSHNILVSENKLKAILDIDSIKMDYSLIPISFSLYKLIKQSIISRKIKNSSNEIERIVGIYFNSLIKEFPIAQKEKNNLYKYASIEIFRRIFIIFSLNINENNNRWNHVLKIHLDGLKEAKIIFDSLKG